MTHRQEKILYMTLMPPIILIGGQLMTWLGREDGRHRVQVEAVKYGFGAWGDPVHKTDFRWLTFRPEDAHVEESVGGGSIPDSQKRETPQGLPAQ